MFGMVNGIIFLVRKPREEDMHSACCEKVLYPVSTYVWCKGNCEERGKHPIFVSSPVSFEKDGGCRFTLQTCKESKCSAFGEPTRYGEAEIGFQDYESVTSPLAKCA